MTLVYFDSSALVKLVIGEAGTELAVELWDGCDAALASRLRTRRFAPRSPLSRAITTWMSISSPQRKMPGRGTGRRSARSNCPLR